MTHRHPHASRLMREAASRLMRLAKGHTFKLPTQGIQTAHLEADNVQQLHRATGTSVSSDRCCRAPAAFQSYSGLVFRQMLS